MNDYSNVYCQQVVNEQMWIPQVEWAIESLLITGFVSFLIFSSKKLLMMEAVKTLLSVYSTGEGVTTFQCFANLDWRMQNTRNTRMQDLKFFLMLFCYLWIVFLPCGCLLLTTFVTCIFYANVSFWKILTL